VDGNGGEPAPLGIDKFKQQIDNHRKQQIGNEVSHVLFLLMKKGLVFLLPPRYSRWSDK
jgi:hypothetical protein